MMYDGLNDMSVPSYIKSLSVESRRRWIAIYETVFAHTGDDVRALLAANTWLRRMTEKQLADEAQVEASLENPQKELIVARATNRSTLKFSVDTSKGFIKRTDSGEEYIVAMLQDVYGDSDGETWSADVLQKFADQINSGSVIIGDIDHEEYDEILDSSVSDTEVKQKLSQKKGIAKGVQAVFENGKLWVKALIDKRYKRLLQEQAKGVSLEAIVTRDDEGKIADGEILGFTFAVDEAPANKRTAIMAI